VLQELEQKGVFAEEAGSLRLVDREKLHQLTESVGKEPAESTSG
jgi:hypothetical protein